MKIADILHTKGHTVHSVFEWQTVSEVVEHLWSTKTGALLVLDRQQNIRGIVSERDIVRALRQHRDGLMPLPVSEIMTRNVRTCASTETVAHAMALMTSGRHRHLPVVDGTTLVGMVSIGDLVKYRVAEMELETGVLRDAALGRY